MSDGRTIEIEEQDYLTQLFGEKSDGSDPLDYEQVTVYNREWEGPSFLPFFDQPDDRPMAPDGNVYYPPGHPRYKDNFGTQGSTEEKAEFGHETWHAKQKQHLGEVEFQKKWLETAEDYDYSEFIDGHKTWQEMGIEEQGKFWEDLYKYEQGGTPGVNNPMYGKTPQQIRDLLPDDYLENPIYRVREDYNSFMTLDPDGDGETTNTYADNASTAVGGELDTASPLILDLGSAGVDLIDINSSDFVYWDNDSDGFAEASGWVGPEDGLLAIDLNLDGIINDNSELFGSVIAEGFQELADLDSNSDGIINASDQLFSSLLVWVDEDSDAYTDEGELSSLSDLSVASISLQNTRVDISNSGNTISNTGAFTYNDSSTGEIIDVWFAASNLNTVFIGDYTPDLTGIYLPQLRGYGTIKNLRIAMSEDNQVGGLMESVIALSEDSFEELVTSPNLYSDIRGIMHRWAGVDGVSSTSRGDYVDARDLAFLEAFTGQPFRQHGYRDDPLWDAGEALTGIFHDIFIAIQARLLLQTSGADLFSNDVSFELASDSISDPGAIDSTALSDVETWATNSGDALPIWQNVLRLVIGARGGEANLTAGDISSLDTAITNSDALLDFDTVRDTIFSSTIDGLEIDGDASANTISGTSNDDILDGKEGNDTVTGGDGKDTLYGDDGDDTLTGGLDDDLIFGGDGDDTFVYNLGDGFDVYRESLESETGDKILFGAGITSSDLSFSRLSNDDLEISINVVGNEGTIVIENQFNTTTSLGFIETIEFSDTSTLDLTAVNHTFTATDEKEILYGVNNGSGGILDTIYGEGGNDQITGYFGTDYLYGGDGDDTIYGGSQTYTSVYSEETVSNYLYGNAGNDYLQGSYGTDYLYGGTGNDTLFGNEGDDEYYFELNGGNDTIDEVNQTDTDTIFFGAGIDEEDLSFVREGANDLRINVQGGLGGSILIVNQFVTTGNEGGIEYVELDDTTVIDLSTLDYGLVGTSSGETLTGLDGFTDIIFGEGGDDTISGQTGADELHGGDGNDTIYGGGVSSSDFTETDTNYLYGNDGEDDIYGSYGTDHIYGGADDDYMAGTKGTDHYYFFRGEGDDTIEDKYSDATDDTIHFGSTISVSDITYERSGTHDLKILINAGFGGSIVIKDQFRSGGSYGAVEYLSFSDTTTVDLTTVNMTTYGTAAAEYLYDVEYNAGLDGTIYAGDGNDGLYGDDGNDTLYGEGGNDNLYGENGDDLLIGGDGNDLLRGGYGDDILRGGLGDDTLDGDYNTDTVDYSQSATAVIIDLEEGEATGEGTDNLVQVENAIGSAFDDTFVTDNYANYIDGGDGSDTLDYSLTYYGAYSITINLATGVTTGSGTSDTFINIENVIGRAGSDNITGDDNANKLEGRNGTDTISGAGGNDLIYGGDGSDTLSGGDGDDVLYGGNGADSMTGGDGADIFAILSGETGTKTITDFTTGDGDALDLSDMLSAYDPMTDLLTDFVEITDSGSNSIVRVDTDGGANSFVQVAILSGVTGLTDEEALETSGNLIAA